MANAPEFIAHKEWLGYVQPVGLVVSIPAMLDANAYINRNIVPEHNRFLSALPKAEGIGSVPEIADFPDFAECVLGWNLGDLYGAPGSQPVPESLEAPLPDYGETLRPTYALHEYQPKDGEREWILLVQVLPGNTDFDAVPDSDGRHWKASPQAKFERLLRKTQVPIGLLVNGGEIRLVYAPEKELSGHLTFKLPEMAKVAGRPIFAAFHMLLSADRLFNMGKQERLPAILENSRKFQNVVSTRLAGQVLEALYELLRGFQAAHDESNCTLLRDVLAQDPDVVYRGLLTTLLRLIFILYAEDRGLLSPDAVYQNYYSVTGLYDRLRVDHGRYPDTMDQRFGAWAQLLTLFRLIYRGGSHGAMRIPAREGYLFDPNRYPFLEGRAGPDDPVSIPRVPDGVLHRVLTKLMLLDGERIGYRTLAVEQIGSVYEAIMGFGLDVAAGQSIAIRPAKKNGAPATINLEELLGVPPGKRVEWFAKHTDQKLSGTAADALKAATSVPDLLAAAQRKIARNVTPDPVARGAMIFQPSDERRRSGSHYTPSSLTGPIVEAALAPVLRQLGANPTPAQILGLKVCDPAMGSGAFLVETCRQLGDALARAWHMHGEQPVLPADEDEALYAQRMIAQRCLYGVDKNPMATDLAKLSLWLATLAKDHPFTFLDHALRSGDALVGLTRKQAASFTWSDSQSVLLDLERDLKQRTERVSEYRRQILESPDNVPYALRQQKLAAAEDALVFPRLAADAVIAAFFSADKPRARENALLVLRESAEALWRDSTNQAAADKLEGAIAALKRGPKGVQPFHWGIEFPEVFSLDKKGEQVGGFDVIVGNPPFAGRNTLIAANRDGYLDWLKTTTPDSQSNADLSAYFFRRAFTLLSVNGCFGLIATNTIAQGESRFTGLRWITAHAGTIYRAVKRLKWPGEAKVVVSVVHVCREWLTPRIVLNGREVSSISSYLFEGQNNEDPAYLANDLVVVSEGSKIYSPGFLFDDADGDASPFSKMTEIMKGDDSERLRILPYLGGEETTSTSTQSHSRFVIDLGEIPLERTVLGGSWAHSDEQQKKLWLKEGIVPVDYADPVARDFPSLLGVLENKVKPYRMAQNDEQAKKFWWRFQRVRRRLYDALVPLDETLVVNCGATPHLALVFVNARQVFAHSLVVFATDSRGFFCVLQSRVHEAWARREASSMKDDLRYTHSSCFHSFPMPLLCSKSEVLTHAGLHYHDFRAELMVRNDEGLTKTYNRFHDPNERSPEIQRLRELHAAMDRAVLDAYGWTDIQPVCEFFPEFDDEEDEDESGRAKRKKYRYRWPEDIHDEVLARLLDLNRQRALEEGQMVVEGKPLAPKAKRAGKKSAGSDRNQLLNFNEGGSD